jgi:diphthine synthase
VGELVFIGLGLYDEKDLSLRALEEARACDILFAEFYTSALRGTTVEKLEAMIGKPLAVLHREDVESGDVLVKEAATRRVGFLVPGDPMMATTHVDLRLRCADAGVRTRIVHGSSIFTAAIGLLGLQAYKFGRTTTIPIPEKGFRPTSPLDVIAANRAAGLHSLVLLDLKEDGRFLTANEALRYLIDLADGRFPGTTLSCIVTGAGSRDPRVRANRAERLLEADLGPPLHCLVIPGALHFAEREALRRFADAPEDALPPPS